MKATQLLCFIWLLPFASIAQNLVPNPGFEDTVSCPDFVSQIDLAEHWSAILNTPDYYHSCNNYCPYNTGLVGVPRSARGYQPAHSGEAMAGIVCYWTDQPDYREAFMVQLTEPLSNKIQYRIGLHIVMNEDSANYAIDGGIGLLLTTAPINTAQYFSFTPQIMNPAGNVLSDTMNWLTIDGLYEANGGEQYLTIGAFLPDSLITIMELGGSYHFTSYAIDDVWVVPDSVWSGTDNTQLHFGLFPNPAADVVQINCEVESEVQYELYNCIGTLVSSGRIENKATIDLSFLPDGLYLVVVRSEQISGCERFFHYETE